MSFHLLLINWLNNSLRWKLIGNDATSYTIDTQKYKEIIVKPLSGANANDKLGIAIFDTSISERQYISFFYASNNYCCMLAEYNADTKIITVTQLVNSGTYMGKALVYGK